MEQEKIAMLQNQAKMWQEQKRREEEEERLRAQREEELMERLSQTEPGIN